MHRACDHSLHYGHLVRAEQRLLKDGEEKMKPRYTLPDGHMPVEQLDEELKLVNPVCLDILYHRGFTTNDQIRSVLFPSYQDAIRPLDCKDKEPAIRCLANAVRSGLEIVVYRDYDVDGISAGALAVETLAALGANVHH